MDYTHTVEYLLTIFGFLTVLVRLRPELGMIGLMFQTMVFLLQLVNLYIKQHAGKPIDAKLFLASVMDHYFKTNPLGQRMAAHTTLDEKVAQVVCEGNSCALEGSSEGVVG